MAPKSDLLQGTLDLLILANPQRRPEHGWGIALTIQQVSREVLQVNQGSLYPALHRLEQQGLVEAEWGNSENNRQAKFYELTSRPEATRRRNPQLGTALRCRGPRPAAPTPGIREVARRASKTHAALDADTPVVTLPARPLRARARLGAALPSRHAHRAAHPDGPCRPTRPAARGPIRFGVVDRVKDDVRDTWLSRVAETFVAGRALRRPIAPPQPRLRPASWS